jgi:RHS repeat-associated protein
MLSQNKEVLCTYHYDALDRLIGLNSVTQDTLQRFYCKSRLATEIQGLVHCSIVQQGDLLLAQHKRLGDALETALLATDQQRSVKHTVGERPLPIVYSPYGHRRAESGLTSLLGFNGERPDVITGHYLLGNGHRAFNPVLMRFNSPDIFSPFGSGGVNCYGYCSGDPVNKMDPTGNTWFLLTTKELAASSIPVRVFEKQYSSMFLYSVMKDSLVDTILKKKHNLSSKVMRRVSAESNAGKKLSQWRSPPRTPETIVASNSFEKIDLLGESPTMKVYKQRLSSELEAYGFESAMTNKTFDRLYHHNGKQRLVTDDLKAAFKAQHEHNRAVGKEPVETISPFGTKMYSDAREILRIREGRN